MTATATIPFSEIADNLNKAIVKIQEKKKVFDAATKAVEVASNDYNESIANAQNLRDMLNKSLNDTMGDPTAGGRVRQSS